MSQQLYCTRCAKPFEEIDIGGRRVNAAYLPTCGCHKPDVTPCPALDCWRALPADTRDRVVVILQQAAQRDLVNVDESLVAAAAVLEELCK